MAYITVQGCEYRLRDVYENVRYATEYIPTPLAKKSRKYMLRVSIYKNAFMHQYYTKYVSYVSLSKRNALFNPIASAVYPVPGLVDNLFEEFPEVTHNLRTYATLFVFDNKVALLFNKRGDNTLGWSLLMNNSFTDHGWEWFQFRFATEGVDKSPVYKALKSNDLAFHGHTQNHERVLSVSYGPFHKDTTQTYLLT